MTFNQLIDDLVLFCALILSDKIIQNFKICHWLFPSSWNVSTLDLCSFFVYLCLARRTLNHNSREKWRVLTVLVMCVRLCAALPRQQVRSGICHAGVGSAPLTSLSSLDKDGRNLPLPLFLSPHSPALPLSSLFTSLCLTLASSISCLFLSTWILLYFYGRHLLFPPLFSPFCILSLSLCLRID